MLGKLLKYDLKWMYKLLVIFYILALVFALIGRALSLLDEYFIFEILSKVSCGISVSMMVNILINNTLRFWARYISNIYKDESYLTHTLPVSKKQIFVAKSLTGLITMLSSVAVIFVSFMICYWGDGLKEFIKMILPGSTMTVAIIAGFVLLLEFIYLLYLGILAITIGYKFNRDKLVKSIAAGFVIYMISSVFSVVILFVTALFNKDVLKMFTTMNTVPSVDALKFMLIVALVIYIGYIILCNVISSKLLQKGVNVD